MKNKFKYLVALVLIFNVFTMGLKNAPVSIKLDGKLLESDQEPVIVKSRVFVPLRVIAENLGAKVEYNASNKTVFIKKDEATYTVAIGGTKVNVEGGKAIEIDAAPFAENNRTMLPLRAIAEMLNVKVSWDDKEKSVFLNTKVAPKKPVDPAQVSGAVGELAIAKLRTMGILQNEGYIPEVSSKKVTIDGKELEGYHITLRKNGPDPERAELVGHYFFGLDKVIYEYDPTNDTYKKLG